MSCFRFFWSLFCLLPFGHPLSARLLLCIIVCTPLVTNQIMWTVPGMANLSGNGQFGVKPVNKPPIVCKVAPITSERLLVSSQCINHTAACSGGFLVPSNAQGLLFAMCAKRPIWLFPLMALCMQRSAERNGHRRRPVVLSSQTHKLRSPTNSCCPGSAGLWGLCLGSC